MVAENWKKITIIGIIVVSILMVLVGLLVGLESLISFFKFIVIALLIISAFGAAFYIVYLLFFAPNYKDIPAQYKKKLGSVTKVMKNDMLGDLYLSGDSKHNRILLGKYFYLRLNLPKIKKENPDSDTITEPIPIDCFIVQKKGFFTKLFNEPFFILVRPDDHDYDNSGLGSAIFHNVTIKGFNLTPLDSQFWTIDRRMLDQDIIKGVALNYIREVVYDIFRDLDKLVKQAMALDHRFQKDKERSREMDLPQIGDLLQGKK